MPDAATQVYWFALPEPACPFAISPVANDATTRTVSVAKLAPHAVIKPPLAAALTRRQPISAQTETLLLEDRIRNERLHSHRHWDSVESRCRHRVASQHDDHGVPDRTHRRNQSRSATTQQDEDKGSSSDDGSAGTGNPTAFGGAGTTCTNRVRRRRYSETYMRGCTLAPHLTPLGTLNTFLCFLGCEQHVTFAEVTDCVAMLQHEHLVEAHERREALKVQEVARSVKNASGKKTVLAPRRHGAASTPDKGSSQHWQDVQSDPVSLVEVISRLLTSRSMDIAILPMETRQRLVLGRDFFRPVDDAGNELPRQGILGIDRKVPRFTASFGITHVEDRRSEAPGLEDDENDKNRVSTGRNHLWVRTLCPVAEPVPYTLLTPKLSKFPGVTGDPVIFLRVTASQPCSYASFRPRNFDAEQFFKTCSQDAQSDGRDICASSASSSVCGEPFDNLCGTPEDLSNARRKVKPETRKRVRSDIIDRWYHGFLRARTRRSYLEHAHRYRQEAAATASAGASQSQSVWSAFLRRTQSQQDE